MTIPEFPQRGALSHRVGVPPVLREFCAVSIALTLLSALYCVVMKLVFHRHYPYSWPLFLPLARFNDFTIFQDKFHFFHTGAFFTTGFPINYPAAMTVLYEIFFKLSHSRALDLFLTVAVTAFVAPAALFGRALWNRGLSAGAASLIAAITLLFSWPALLLLDRANVEVLVWIVLAFGMWAFARGREWTAAAMFGVAAALKLFPFVFLVLFFTRKKYPKLLFGAFVFGLVNLVSLAILGPTVMQAYRGLALGMASFKANYMATYLPNEGGLDHSILAFCKAIIFVIKRGHAAPALQEALDIYLPLTAAAGVLLYFLRIRLMPWLNQVLALTIICIYFTPFSGDGTLIHLYYAFALCSFVAVDAWRRKVEIPGLRLIFLCFAWLLSTESFFIHNSVRYEGQAKCVGLGVLLIASLWYPLGPPVDEATIVALPDTSRIKISGVHR